MTHPDPQVEDDRRISKNLTSQLAGKQISKITMVDAYEGRHGSACNGRMTFEFTDGTYFVLDESSQEGSMEYEVLPTAKEFFKDAQEIDNVEYFKAKYLNAEFKTFTEAQHKEMAADAMRLARSMYRLHEALHEAYGKK